jgi:hypothetical protein
MLSKGLLTSGSKTTLAGTKRSSDAALYQAFAAQPQG